MKVYFDNAATTKVRDEVIDEISLVLKNCFGNPSSTHSFGRSAKSYIETSRKSISKILNCEPGEIIFNSGGTESDNSILKCAVKDLGVKHIISSKIEHHAITHTLEELESQDISIHYVKLKNNEALFLAKVIYKQGLINIRKDIKLNLKVKYDLKKNELFLIFDNSIINMERRGVLLNSIDIKGFYEPKLIFNGPKLKNKYFKTQFNPKRKIYIKPNFAEIFIENGTIDLILNLSFVED